MQSLIVLNAVLSQNTDNLFCVQVLHTYLTLA